METDCKARTEIRLTALETRSAVDEVHRVNVAARLSSIEDTLKWVVRLILGAFLMSAVAFVLRGGMALT